MGKTIKGISVAYCTDSRPVDRITKFVEGVQLFICEGMYGEEEKAEGKEKQAHAFSEAARMAKNANAERLWLTHFSPSLNEPEAYLRWHRRFFL